MTTTRVLPPTSAEVDAHHREVLHDQAHAEMDLVDGKRLETLERLHRVLFSDCLRGEATR